MYSPHGKKERELKYVRAFFIQPKISIMKKSIQTIFACSVFLLTTFQLKAQTDADAFRYTGTSITGTARFTSMSGAFGALGGDFSSLSTNPAGIGIYRSSEITFTPSVFTANTKSSFLGNKTSENKFNFNIGNAGIVLTNKLRKDEGTDGWKSWSFGFGYNRQDNYHTYSVFEGKNTDNSMLDYFAEKAGNQNFADLNNFYEYLAYYTFLINPDNDTATTQYFPAITEYGQTQRMTKESRGSKGETVFSFGGNFNNKLYLGATMGITSLNYSEESTYEELTNSNVIDTLKSYAFQQNLTTDGNGINIKFGLIYRPTDFFRFGLAIHSPTWYTMHDDYKNYMDSKFIGGHSYSQESLDGSFDYEMTTPFKAMGSFGFVFGTFGILGADYEMTDYSSTRFNSSTNSFFDVNKTIQAKYDVAHTFRIGTEWKYENISFRGGFSYTTSPIKSTYTTSGSDYSKIGYSAGIGMKEKNFFLDLGYLYTQSNQYFQPYTLSTESVPGVKNDVSTHNFTITCGVKF